MTERGDEYAVVEDSYKETEHTEKDNELELVDKSIPSFEEQKKIVHAAINEQLEVGDKWYLVEIRWYKQWKKFLELQRENETPGPIDNSPLFEPGTTKVKEHLLEGSDFKLISKTGWEHLVNWYHLMPGQEPISRNVIEHGMYVKDKKVEVYLIELKLSTFRNLEQVKIKHFSKVDTLMVVVETAKSLFGIPAEEEVRMWNRFTAQTYNLLTKLESTLQDCGIGSEQMMVIEQKNENSEWTRPTRSRSISSSSSTTMASSPTHTPGSGDSSSTYSSYSQISSTNRAPKQRQMSVKPGLCGLSNLGNTCFMNAALQCLSNTQPLTKYFLSGTYKHDINPSNPLGMHGKIAEAYAELVQKMWNGHNSYFTPRDFKMQVGRFAPQFSGYQQQDSHELLAFLLDGLHEDLNRVKQKPYVELQDDKGRPDAIIAKEAWRNHSLRNSSVIVDNFHGQFKSTVECPVCEKVSVTFDPFCYLSLPLPVKKERNITITYISLDPSKKPLKLKVTVPKDGKTTDLAQAVSKLTGHDSSKLVVFDVFGSKFHKIYNNREALSHITDRDDIYVYEIPIDASNADREELLILPVYLREIKPQTSRYSYSYSYSSNTLFGVPLLIAVPKNMTTPIDLYQLILRAMRRFVQAPSAGSSGEDEALKQAEEPQEDEESMDEEQSQEEDEAKVKEDTQEKEKVVACSSKATEEEKEEEKQEKKSTEPVMLFEIKLVNSAGTHDIRSLSFEDNQPLDLSSKSYLAIDWYPKLKKKYYDEKLAKEIEEHESVRALPPSRKNIQLSDCLELFLQREQLGEEDPWFCPQCKEHRQAYKKFDLWSLPKVLVVHLKRFSYNRYWRDKIDAFIDFPTQHLDLTPYVINRDHPRAVYDLHAVANHYGGLGGGHYTAYGINCYDGQWHYFDDTSVSSSDTCSPVSKAAYVLFYTRRDDPDNEMMNISELLTEDSDTFQNGNDIATDEDME